MSEFKFACPVCGQHIKCDSTQAGTAMDCPTCFQQITVPQAPSGEQQKFILTGTKVVQRPAVATGRLAPEGAPAATGKFAGGLVIGAILLFIGVTVAVIYWATIIHPREVSHLATPGTNAPGSSESVLAAEPDDGSLWTLDLDTNAIPETPAAGRVYGQRFVAERTVFQNGSLTLRTAHNGPDLSVTINFSGLQPEVLAGKSLNVTTNADRAAQVILRWKDDTGKPHKDRFDENYAMRLEFGALAANRLPGKIRLCTPDPDHSYVAGSFVAEARKPKPATKH